MCAWLYVRQYTAPDPTFSVYCDAVPDSKNVCVDYQKQGYVTEAQCYKVNTLRMDVCCILPKGST